ncbi:sulfurtransferase [Antarcticirhabdus aurantiaca]|uniref:Sulfurtransferase n=1 Tax=Antarcticirhabdus aurantiaca TaxID=2606717 RepID=A0ACD4NMC4_9HYPH|nr:sulfurtransferase [Antarcticirhabdus aurantiaca]WAJ27842.1 sulfurtransferase [Jeongeuplla avenae]
MPPSARILVSAAALLAATSSAFALDAPAGPLVTTDWLETNLGDPDLRLIEVSVDPGTFERGHIEGAQNVVWHTDLVDPVQRDIADRESFEALVQKLGIDEDSTVVLYGDNNNWFAAWGAWVFDTYGIDVKLLDGGRKKWEAENLPLTTRVASVAPSEIALPERDEALRARLADVLAVAKGGREGTIVDIRSPDEYSGKVFAPEGSQELSIRAGHVPGAINVPWSTAVAEDGTFKPAEELKRIYAEKGIDGSKPTIVYCRIGERSSHTWFLLSKILGYDVKNYDGSWTEYGNSVGAPIVNVSNTVWTGK